MISHLVFAWLLANLAKPLVAAFAAITTVVVTAVGVASAWLAQIDLTNLDPIDAVVPVTGTGIIIWAVRFLVNFYREALEVSRQNLEVEREDRAEDHDHFQDLIRDLRERNALLESQLLAALCEKSHLEARLAEGT